MPNEAFTEITLRRLPLPLKMVATCFLVTIGVAYLFAIVYLYMMDVQPQTAQGYGLLKDVVTKYYGNRGTSRLEGALNGGMAELYCTNGQA